MKRSSQRGVALAAIVAMVLSAHAQESGTQYATITQQPLDQCVALGSTATFSVAAAGATSYQWLFNNVPLDGQTNSSIQISDVSLANVGLYSAFVYNGSDAVPTRSATLDAYVTSGSPAPTSTPSALSSGSTTGVAPMFAPGGGGPFLVVFGAPVVSGGGNGNCPGKYSGYVNYLPPSGWGFLPASGASLFTATDTNLSITKIQYVGLYGDNGCDQTTVTIPSAISPQYRFTTYFPPGYPVPTNAYPLSLVGFNP